MNEVWFETEAEREEREATAMDAWDDGRDARFDPSLQDDDDPANYDYRLSN